MRRIILPIIVVLFGFYSYLSTAGALFTDISNVDRSNFEKIVSVGGLTDTGNHTFSGGVLATRGFFSQVLLSSTCTQCSVPSQSQLDRYKISSFSDIEKKNVYYYCAEESRGTNVLGDKNSCSNGATTDTRVFCSQDTLSRMEATIALLRQAKVWDDSKNAQYTDKTTIIADISNTSPEYGYAVKGIQLGILKIGQDKKIYPNTTITQGEVVDMASKMLDYTQCRADFGKGVSNGSNITSTGIGLTYRFQVAGAVGGTYRWSMGDGYITASTSPEISYTYKSPGTYDVSVYIYESESKASLQGIKISVLGEVDTDGDGVLDNADICPLVIGVAEKSGCPKIKVGAYGKAVSDLLGGISQTSNSLFLSGIRKNACLLKYQNTQGLIIGSPVCDQCPCSNRVDILADIRSCDILFPSILSPDFSMMYSRGAFYQIP